jgi:hypothetical protein
MTGWLSEELESSSWGSEAFPRFSTATTDKPGCSPCDRPAVDPTYFETYKQYQVKARAVADPTTLILVDEVDRFHMNSLEQIRSIFNEDTNGLAFICMPGI